MALGDADSIIIKKKKKKNLTNPLCYKQGIDFFLEYPFTKTVAKGQCHQENIAF